MTATHGTEGIGRTYAANLRVRRLANAQGDNPMFGQRILGPKSAARLARIARRLTSRVRRKQHTEALAQEKTHAGEDRVSRNRASEETRGAQQEQREVEV